MSNIMTKLFGGIMNQQQNQPPNQSASPQPAPGTPGNIPNNPSPDTKSSSGTASNGAVPNTDVTQNNSQSPLAEFSNLWEPNKVDPNAKPTNQTQAIDPDKLKDVVSKANFVNALPQDTLKAIVAGGEGAIEALTTALNTVSQQVLLHSTLASDKMFEQRLNAAMSAYEAKIPDIVRNNQVSDSLNSKNTLFKNPAVAPLVEALKTQLTQKHPNATTSEITAMAENYMVALSKEFSPKDNTQNSNSSVNGETDWEKFLSI